MNRHKKYRHLIALTGMLLILSGFPRCPWIPGYRSNTTNPTPSTPSSSEWNPAQYPNLTGSK